MFVGSGVYVVGSGVSVQILLQPVFSADMPVTDDSRAESRLPVYVRGTAGICARNHTVEGGMG